MPIYAYKCESCGFAKDVLQKVSDPVLTDCPACGAAAFKKQLTAAGFQLKGSGWYVTDFRDGGGAKKSEPTTTDSTASTTSAPAAESAATTETQTSTSPAATPPAPAAAT